MRKYHSFFTNYVILSTFLVFNTSFLRAEELVDPFSMTLEELGNVEITSVSRTNEKANESPAALFVINKDDIRRSTATSVPELLRIVPGLQVARIDANNYAISARGFNSGYSNKLLILIDGRTVYDPVFSGLFWDQEDLLLSDIERIEVIRGPGASAWGVNAVNGVINIITKNAADTHGTRVLLGGGNEDYTVSGIRSGTDVGENGHIRLYAKGTIRDDSKLKEGGTHSIDDSKSIRTGFRYDHVEAKNKLSLHGDSQLISQNAFSNVPILTPPYSRPAKLDAAIRSQNLTSRWDHELSSDESLSLQAFVNQSSRDSYIFNLRSTTYDFELQHNVKNKYK